MEFLFATKRRQVQTLGKQPWAMLRGHEGPRSV